MRFLLVTVISVCVAGTFAAAPRANAAQEVVPCLIVNVATLADRVHVLCKKQVASACDFAAGKECPGTYYAVETSSPMASQVVQIGLAALTGKRTVEVFVENDEAANPPGCLASDCRRILGMQIR